MNRSPSNRTLSRHEVRDVDRRAVEQFGMPSVVMMENAGRGAAELLLQLGIQGEVVICAGKGNNGGDGFVIARHLENHAQRVLVLLLCDPHELAGDAAINYGILQRAGTPLEVLGSTPDLQQLAEHLRGSDWIVDALLGTGTQGEIREPYRSVIELINASPARVLAVDLPSGLDCDTGQALGPCVQADHTATFVARKRGFDAEGARAFTGAVHVIDIGVPRSLLDQFGNHGGSQQNAMLVVPAPPVPDMYAELEALLRQVPRGKVTTYGDLAAALGSRSAARWVGEFLREHPHQADCNCHRVVRVDGDVGLFVASCEEKIQILEQESIAVVDGRVDLGRHRFDAFASTRPLVPLLEFQQALPEQVALRPFTTTPELVGALDVAYPSAREAVAAFALVETVSRELVWSTTVRCPVRFPYITGLLGFREIPALLELMAHVAAEGRTPELVLVDGNGILHYRFAGIASHFGVASGLPTIGIGKKLLCGRVDLKGLEPGEQRHVTYEDRVVGTAVKSGPHSRPIFISPGHGIDVGHAARIGQLLLGGHRLPEPLYWADALSKQAARAVKQQG